MWPSRQPGVRVEDYLLLGDLLGRRLLGGGLLGRRLLGRRLGRGRGGLGLLRQLDADQLGGALADRAGLAGDIAQRLLGQLDRAVDSTLGAGAFVLDRRLPAEPLQRGLAALNKVLVGGAGGLDVTLGGLAQLL